MAALCTFCVGPIYPPDSHENCVACLGLAHAKAALSGSNCPHCDDFPVRVLHAQRILACGESGQWHAAALQSSKCLLRELDLSNNDLQDSGVKLISDALKSHNCKLQILRLSGCMVTEEGCSYLASALSLNPSHLRELDLSYNHPGHSGVQLLYDRLNHPLCALEILNVEHGGEFRITAGKLKYACDLTLDPNTAHTHLILSEENRKVRYVQKSQQYPDHPERFEFCEQVLCTESLTGRCYWEAEWIGWADVSVTYKGISRKGRSDDCLFGFKGESWTLKCSDIKFTVFHNNKRTVIPPIPGSKKVGVYLDWSAGILSFYIVSDTHKLTHLHTVYTTFTEPLYAGFMATHGVSLCKITDTVHCSGGCCQISQGEGKCLHD